MKNRQRRLLPDNRWDTGAIESWLEDRAARGWILEKCGGWSAVFGRAEPRPCRVRLDIPGDRTQSRQEEVDEACREMGWRRAAVLDDYLVYYCFDPAAPELQTDPVAEGWLREKMLKKARRSLLGAWVFLFACPALLAWHYLRSGTPVEDFLYGSGAAAALFLLFFPLLVLGTVRSLRGIRELRRQIAAGLPGAHAGDWRKRRRTAMTGMAVLTAFYLLLLGYPLWQGNAGWGGSLDEADRPLPYVAASVLDPSLEEESRTWDSCIVNVSVLAPEQYQIWEAWGERARVVTCYDRLRFSAFARPLYEERLASVLEAWPEAAAAPLDHPGFDGAVLVTAGENTFLEAYRGKAVLHAGAFGVSGLEDRLDDYAALLASFA